MGIGGGGARKRAYRRDLIIADITAGRDRSRVIDTLGHWNREKATSCDECGLKIAAPHPLVKYQHGRNETGAAYGAGKSCGLSKQAESGGAGRGAWEISPAT